MATPIPDNQARFTAAEIARATSGTLVPSSTVDSSAEVSGLFTDSRALRPDSAFVALVGEKLDAHTLLDRVDGKARVIVRQKGRGPVLHASAVVEVDDTLRAWGDLAAAHLTAWRALGGLRRVVGVTGSAGKTTTKELTAALLGAYGEGRVQKTRGNLNNRIGMPATAFTVGEAHALAVLELGMSIPGEIAAMASAARPDVGIVTNIGVAHAEGVGGREGVAREKGDLYAHLSPSGTAIVNLDCDLGPREARRSSGVRAVTFGRHEQADYRLLSRSIDAELGARIALERPSAYRGSSRERLEIGFPLLGEHAAIDLLAALAAAECALDRSLSVEEIEASFSRTELVGRGALRVLGHGAFVLDDTYNANPQSMAAALRTLGELAPARRKVAVLGEMRELGALAEAEHDALAELVKAAGVGLFVSCGGLMDRTAERVRACGIPTSTFITAQDAATFVTSVLDPSDIVLVKGSRSIATEHVVEALVRAHGERAGGAR